MDHVDDIRNSLIDKLLAIRNKDFLKALDKLVVSSSNENFVAITPEQKLMLQMSEDDIASNNLISQEELDKEDLAWLKKK
ncbi:MAG: hypothetical protein ACJAUV_002394 [Flavobacteriales bacterium]|jgi:hypothetical protein